MILTDDVCEKLCKAAKEKSKSLGIDISFAVCDNKGFLKLFRHFGDALILSINLVPKKAYTAAVTRIDTKTLASLCRETGTLPSIQTTDSQITLVAGGYPLLYNEKVIGAIGVGGGTENQDIEIAEYIISVFDKIK